MNLYKKYMRYLDQGAIKSKKIRRHLWKIEKSKKKSKITQKSKNHTKIEKPHKIEKKRKEKKIEKSKKI